MASTAVGPARKKVAQASRRVRRKRRNPEAIPGVSLGAFGQPSSEGARYGLGSNRLAQLTYRRSLAGAIGRSRSARPKATDKRNARLAGPKGKRPQTPSSREALRLATSSRLGSVPWIAGSTFGLGARGEEQGEAAVFARPRRGAARQCRTQTGRNRSWRRGPGSLREREEAPREAAGLEATRGAVQSGSAAAGSLNKLDSARRSRFASQTRKKLDSATRCRFVRSGSEQSGLAPTLR